MNGIHYIKTMLFVRYNNMVYIRIAMGVGLLAIFIGFIDPLQMVEMLRTLKPTEALKALSAFLIAVGVLEGARIQILFKEYGLNYQTALTMAFVGVFFGNFTPGMLGAEIYKIHYVHRLRAGIVKPLVLVAVLRFIGLAVTVFATLLVLVVFDIRFIPMVELVTPFSRGWLALLVAAGVAGVSMVLVVLLRRAWRTGRMTRLLALWQGMIDALKQIRTSQLLAIIGLSLLVLCTRAACLIWLVHALSGSLGPAEGLLAAAGSVLASALPISFGGLGVQEGALAGILFAFGIPESIALAVALMNRLLIWLIALAGGLIFLLSRVMPNPSDGNEA